MVLLCPECGEELLKENGFYNCKNHGKIGKIIVIDEDLRHQKQLYKEKEDIILGKLR